MRALRMLPALCVALLLLAPSTSTHAGPGYSNDATVNQPGTHPVRDMAVSGVPDDCSLLTFEGIPNNTPVGTYHGPVDVIFGTSWLGIIDADAGGSGNFANEPSPSTTAYFLDTNDISIQLSPPVRFVQFQYSAAALSLPVTVYAYDNANNLIATSSGNVVGTDYDGAQCVGDPTGNFCSWAQINLISAVNNIASVKITGAVANFFGIDNLYFCTSTTAVTPGTWGKIKSTYR